MTRDRGSRQQSVKRHNRGLVLRAILNEGVCTRTGLARRLHLTKMALSNIVGELIGEGILSETGNTAPQAGAGRRPGRLCLSPAAPAVCGILIRRGELRAVTFDLCGRPLSGGVRTFSGRITPEDFCETLARLYREAAEGCGKPVLAVGVASAGPLNVPEGTLSPDGLFTRQHVFPAAEFFGELSGRPVFLCNDATAGALAERLFGMGRSEDSFTYISTLNGIGAGLFLDGRLYNAGIGQNGELGHMSINFDGPKCACGGRGCLELYADPDRILRQRPDSRERYPEHPFFAEGFRLTFPALHGAADGGDPLALEILDEYCRYLGFAVRNLGAQLSVGLVILAGAPGTRNRVFERILREKIERDASAICPPCRVVESGFGMDAPVYGSAGIVLEKIYGGELEPSVTSDRKSAA